MPATGNNHYLAFTLSIRLSADGFCFYVCNPQDNSLIRSERFTVSSEEEIAEKLQQELSRKEYFNRNIDQVFVLTCSPSTRVPMELFRREEAQTLYELAFSVPNIEQYHIIYNILPRLEAIELYRIRRDIEDIILQFYPTARFFGTNAMLLERLLHIEEEASPDVRRLYLCMLPEQLSLFHFQNGNLVFANNFPISSINDTLYLILYTWKMLDLNVETDHLVTFANELPSKFIASNLSHLVKALSDYISHIDSIMSATLFPRIPLAHEKAIPLDLLALLLNRL